MTAVAEFNFVLSEAVAVSCYKRLVCLVFKVLQELAGYVDVMHEGVLRSLLRKKKCV